MTERRTVSPRYIARPVRGKWHPSSDQISLALDCAAARLPIVRAAALLGVGPRSLWIFIRRLGLPLFDVWRDRPRYVPFSSYPVAARTAETPALVHQGTPAQEGGS
jgi:hypothetical protein